MLIDVFSDLVCPWCYIGHHRLSRALAERPRARVTRRWHPFPLNPDLPRHGMNSSLYMALRFGSRDRARLHLEADPERDLALFLANISSYQLDLHAVPCFIFDRRFVLAGAQETTAFLPLLDLALSDPSLDSA